MPSSGDLSALTLTDIATLGLTMNGYLAALDGSLASSGAGGLYWCSSGSSLSFGSAYATMNGYGHANGFSVRCLQDL